MALTTKEKMELALKLLKEFDQMNDKDFENMFDDAIESIEDLLEQYTDEEIETW
ncbi:MAG: hypothetical protein R3321_09550 [Nitrososphaeraceae archaeon]|nr:hypothetical protein [Nitrososphaeraceae archaeon]